MRLLTKTAVVLAIALAVSPPARAHDDHDPARELGEALRDLLDQMEPALDEALEFLQEFQGGYDPRHYRMPEVLPNGDIIIRRRGDAPPFGEEHEAPPAPDAPEDSTIDL